MSEVVIVPADRLETEVSSGTMTRLAGVSKNLTGAQGIHLALATIPSGCSSSPHWHDNCESAIYVLSGRGKMRVREELTKALDFGPGDFIYIPTGAIHQPVNSSSAEPIHMIVARNAPTEIVIEYRP